MARDRHPPSGVNAHERGGVVPVVDNAPALAVGTAGVEPGSGAERATAAKPHALKPEAYGMVGRRHETPPKSDPGRRRRTPPRGDPKGRARYAHETPTEGDCRPEGVVARWRAQAQGVVQGRPNEGNRREVETPSSKNQGGRAEAPP